MKAFALAAVFVVAAAWAVSQPVPECPPHADQTASLSCELAVTEALSALPADHPPVMRIQFLYGSLIPYFPALLGSGQQATIGVVKFTYEDGSREYVDVAAGHGELIAAAPLAY